MYSRNRKKAKSGSVQIRNSNDRLQLVFTFGGKRYFVSTGLGDNPYNRKLARDKALELERDIAYGEFNPEKLSEYKPSPVLTTTDPDAPISNTIPNLSELWELYRNARSSGKSPATVRMYGWVANHLARCPYRLATESQAIFDWLNANVPANSAKRVLMHLSACCKWAKKSGLLNSNPFEGNASDWSLD
jgi:integrase